MLACRLEVRQSCGCPARSVSLAGGPDGTESSGTPAGQPASDWDALRGELLVALAEETGLGEAEAGRPGGRLNGLIEALWRDVAEGDGGHSLAEKPSPAARRLPSLPGLSGGDAASPTAQPEGGRGEFLLELEDLLRADVAAGREASRWQNAISRLRAGTLRVGGALGQGRIEALFGQARVMIAETSQRGHAQQLPGRAATGRRAARAWPAVDYGL